METEMENVKARLQGIEKYAHGQTLLRLQVAEGMVQRAEQALASSEATRPGLMPASSLRRHQRGLPRSKIP